MNNELIREVNQAVQRDQMREAVKRYGKAVIVLIVTAVLGVGGYYYSEQHQRQADQEATKRLTEGREFYIAGKYDDARKLFADLAEESEGVHMALARLWQAKSELAAGRDKEATDTFAAIVAQPGVDASYAGLACLQGRMIVPDDARFAGCGAKTPYAALLAETTALQAIAANEPEKAQAVLPAERLTQEQSRRLGDVKAYLAGKTEPETKPEGETNDEANQ